MSFGKQIKEARERKGLSLADVREETRVATSVIEALEAEDMTYISAPIFGRGYLKLICEFIGIDNGPIIEDFNRQYAAKSGKASLAPMVSMERYGGASGDSGQKTDSGAEAAGRGGDAEPGRKEPGTDAKPARDLFGNPIQEKGRKSFGRKVKGIFADGSGARDEEGPDASRQKATPKFSSALLQESQPIQQMDDEDGNGGASVARNASLRDATSPYSDSHSRRPTIGSKASRLFRVAGAGIMMGFAGIGRGVTVACRAALNAARNCGAFLAGLARRLGVGKTVAAAAAIAAVIVALCLIPSRKQARADGADERGREAAQGQGDSSNSAAGGLAAVPRVEGEEVVESIEYDEDGNVVAKKDGAAGGAGPAEGDGPAEIRRVLPAPMVYAD